VNARKQDYATLVREAFGLAPDADALDELDRRLHPDDPAERPPATAPAVRRLRAALAVLRERGAPETTPAEFAEDLQVLKLFAPDDEWSDEALGRLLGDVAPSDKPRHRRLRPVPRPDEPE
jgi:hypothetical protein